MSKEGRNADGTFSKGHPPLRKKVSWIRAYQFREQIWDEAERMFERYKAGELSPKQFDQMIALMSHILPAPKLTEPLEIPKMPLETLSNIKTAAITATDMMADGDLSIEDTKAYTYQLKVIGELIVGTDLEKRVEEVEKKVK